MGIFRLSGSKPEIDAIRKEIDSGEKVDLSYTDEHALAGILKSFLRELPDPLCTEKLYPEWVSIRGIVDIYILIIRITRKKENQKSERNSKKTSWRKLYSTRKNIESLLKNSFYVFSEQDDLLKFSYSSCTKYSLW